MIRLSKVSKTYSLTSQANKALVDVNLQIHQGEFVSVMGPSGCGKSTLLNIIGLIDMPTQGSYKFLGEELSRKSESELVRLRRNSIGFIFQNFNLIEHLSIAENVGIPLAYAHVSKTKLKFRVREVLELVGLENQASEQPSQLSGGQQQRVAIARAVVNSPEIILADEPTGNLDSEMGDSIVEMLSVLNQEGTTVLMATHSMERASAASRFISLSDGKITNQDEN